ncbi:MAG: ABC transporter permease [Spirochaetales bacterium]|nr:ABC transporter permease [Spirochaetales bacterium]
MADQAAEARAIAFRRTLKGWLNNRVVIAFLLVVALFVAGEIIVPGFLHFSHIMTVLQASFFLGLVSLGQTIVVLSGREGLDLSVGSMVTVGVILGAFILMGKDANLAQTILAVLAAGFLLGLVNGLGVAFLKLAPLIMTLAWGIVVNGLLIGITKGLKPGKASPILEVLGQGSLVLGAGEYALKIPWVNLIWVIVIVLVWFFLKRTSGGYILYAVGANDRAAELLGIRVRLVRVMAYAVSGMLSAFSGLLLLGFVQHPDLQLGERYVLPSAVAVIIGGIRFGGGAGTYLGAVAGSIFLTTLASVLVTLNMDEGARQIVTGLVLVVLLAAYTRRIRR